MEAKLHPEVTKAEKAKALNSDVRKYCLLYLRFL